MDDAQLRDLLGSSETTGGWGKHQTVRVVEADVFVKRVQVTDLEDPYGPLLRNVEAIADDPRLKLHPPTSPRSYAIET
jgi:hypothetical protein